VPEGHTLHRLARALQPLVGQRVRATSPQGRFADGAREIDAKRLTAVEAFGKHLLLDFGNVSVHVHLGLAGSMFRSDPASQPRPGVRLRLDFDDPPEVTWDLVAPFRCELLSGGEREVLLARLGPDPLRGDDPTPAFARISDSHRTIGELLLDQRVIAGVGNVLRAEVLHQCGIHPARPGSSVRPEEFDCLWKTLTRLMERATTEGRIVTVEAPPGIARSSIDQSDGRYAYKQDRCRACGAEILSWQLGSLMAYACEVCQPVT
jgi:endonuclease VIII